METTKNTVEATNQPNLYEKLESLQENLVLCEKALAEYLETKRLAFPRFYFVSSADLLDILSNGNNPPVVSLLLMANFLMLIEHIYYRLNIYIYSNIDRATAIFI